MTRMLASVTNVDEALAVLEGGADFIDLKNPAQGALGALPIETIREIVAAVAGRKPVSATIGDLPMLPDLLVEQVRKTAGAGVDIVKIGLFGHAGHAECIRALAPCARQGVALIAVMLADERPDFTLLPLLAQCRFRGVMLDTARKDGSRLVDWLSLDELREFVAAAGALQLMTGLAGSLRVSDIPALAALGPDYLGFRGALCAFGNRVAGVDSVKLQSVRENLLQISNKIVALA